jgi:uncharacterized protein (TIGR02147 family)
MVNKDKKGHYKVTDKVIETGKEILNLGTINFHAEVLKVAGKAIKDTSKKKKNFTGPTLGISEETYESMLDELDKFQDI